MIKETVRANGGDAQSARADIISGVRSMGTNRDEIFAVLTRNNKLFNKEGVRFSVGDGGIMTLNGKPVDLLQFGSLSQTDRSVHLINLPSMPEPTQAEIQQNQTVIKTLAECAFNNVEKVSACYRLCASEGFCHFAAGLLRMFSRQLQEYFMVLLRMLYANIADMNIDLTSLGIRLNSNIVNWLLEVIFEFVHRGISRYVVLKL